MRRDLPGMDIAVGIDESLLNATGTCMHSYRRELWGAATGIR